MRTALQTAKTPDAWLTELLSDPAKALACVPAEAIPSLRGELARLDSLLLGRMLAGSANGSSHGDRLLNCNEASDKLAVTKDWLYRNADTLPFTVRNGKKHVRFSESGIEEWIRRKSSK
jgi:predicted DNA-binding transcriptional regulator AlpA